ncbi:MAG TPA: tRNA uridine-5-carboxymethylaminomethyl(34) synthesis GTPase MnmE [Spirochaetaceae bacterium]|jgi:tRNA modification GTPase|nr:tRNA uridine-5-carboxymethylaminomethyl(34) synthesis GTPase MnmE [Spirochaetaceae bacterium]
MARTYLSTHDDVAALATPPGAGALAVLRLAGPSSIARLAAVFSKPDLLKASAGSSAVYGKLVDAEGRSVDEVVAVVFRAPKSYTGQDGVDLMCHGGPATVEAALAALFSTGFKQALPGEFTFRAFSAGKMDLVRAQAVDELVKARTRGAQSDALARLGGSLSRELDALRRELLRLSAACALRLDYGEDENPEDLSVELPALAAARGRCQALADSYALGRLFAEGALVALAGRTNAGKSSLFNRLLKEERAIVSQQHGTTRDYLEAELDLGGIPVRILDTAGLRESHDPVEREGVRRSRLLAEGADLIVYLADATVGLAAEDEGFLTERPEALRVWNKVDDDRALPAPPGWLPLSALDGSGEGALAAALIGRLAGNLERAEPGLRISSARQRDALLRCARALGDAEEALRAGEPADIVALDLATALAALGELSGETTSEDILDSMFSNFCVGK